MQPAVSLVNESRIDASLITMQYDYASSLRRERDLEYYCPGTCLMHVKDPSDLD